MSGKACLCCWPYIMTGGQRKKLKENEYGENVDVFFVFCQVGGGWWLLREEFHSRTGLETAWWGLIMLSTFSAIPFGLSLNSSRALSASIYMLLILACPKVTLYSGFLMLPNRLSQDWGRETAFVMGSVEQEFGWSTVVLACLCSMMSGVIAGRRESCGLESSAVSCTHTSGSGCWLVAGGLSSSECGLYWASLKWWLGYWKAWTVFFLWSTLFPYIPLVTTVTAPPKFKKTEHDPILGCQSHDKKSMGEERLALPCSVKALYVLLMSGPIYSTVINNNVSLRNLLGAGIQPVTFIFFSFTF